MSELTALVAACLDAPNDDAPILILCDWLDERGDRRGWRLRRYFKMSRAQRAEREAELKQVEKLYPAGHDAQHRAYILDLYNQRLGDVEWRLLGWFWKYFKD